MSSTRVAREILGMIIIVGVLLALSLLHERTTSAQFHKFLKTENASDSRIETVLDEILSYCSSDQICDEDGGEK